MNRFNGFLEQFCSFYDYPNEAVTAFRDVFEQLNFKEEYGAPFEAMRKRFLLHQATIYDLMEELHGLAATMGIAEETLDFVFLLSLVEDLLEKYRFAGVEESVYWETMADLGYKLRECLAVRHIPGTFVTGWFNDYFRLERFAFGRFQYEIRHVRIYHDGEPRYYTLSSGAKVNEGDLFLNLHIPSSGVPLTEEVRLASYQKAWEHLHLLFPNGKALFGCHSWLLYPNMQKFLPETMNVIQFQKDFCIVDSEDDPTFHNAWRLYSDQAGKPVGELPRDTTFRRLYAEWLSQGNTAGDGLGSCLYDGKTFEK